MEAPGALEVTRIPSVNVPVCVVKGVSAPPCVSGVVTSVPGCVLPSTPCMSEQPGVNETPCVEGKVGVNENPCVEGMTCVRETPCASGRPGVSGTTCAREIARVSERPSVRGTACVRSLCVREMTVGMREYAATSPGVSVMEWSVSVVTGKV